jgi:O-antigen ligase
MTVIREENHANLAQRVALWAAYALFTVALGAAVLLRGGVYPQQWAWSALVITVAGMLVAGADFSGDVAERCEGSWALWLMGALLAWMALQWMPLPAGMVAWLSPQRYAQEAFARTAAGAHAARGWLSLSVAPAGTIERLLDVAPSMVAFFVARELSWRSRRSMWTVAVPVMLVATLEGLLGLAQFYGMRMNEMEASAVTGTYVNRNHFAGLLEMAFPLAIMGAAAVWRNGSAKRGSSALTALATIGLIAVAGCLVFGVVVSLSRMGFLSIVAGTVLTAVIVVGSQSRGSQAQGNWRWAIPAALIVLAVVFLPTRELADRFASTADTDLLTSETRVAIWRDTIHEIEAYKWTGSGLGAYERGLYKYKTAAPTNTVDFAHNDYLQIVAELGFVGAALVAALLVAVLWNVLRVVLWSRGQPNWELAVGLLGALLTIGLHSLADFNLYIPANALALAWLAGAADSAGLRATAAKAARRRSRIYASVSTATVQ